MRRYLTFLALFFCVGCHSNVNQVEYVIPNGFQGTIIIRREPGAPEIPKVNGRYVLNIREDGTFVFDGYDPFHPHLRTARFANGDPIWVSTRGDRPEARQIALFGGYTSVEWSTEKGQGVPDYRIFIGTEEQWRNSSAKDRKEE